MAVEIRVPSMGESVSEAVISEWLQAEGDRVERDQPVVVLDTDKANMEIPAPASGRLSRIARKAGETVRVGDVIGTVEAGAGGESPVPPESPDDETVPPAAAETARPQVAEEGPTRSGPPPVVTPAARRLLAERGLRPEEVANGGRIGKEDVQRHLASAPTAATPPPTGSPPPDEAPRVAGAPSDKVGSPPPRQAPPGGSRVPSGSRREETVPMSPLRRRVAQRLVEAQQTAALLTTFNEADMSAVQDARKRFGEAFQKEHGLRLGFMSFFVKASIEALKAFPELNASVQGDSIVYHDYFDIGVAVGAPRGLVVPILRNAERLSFVEIERQVADFGERARAGRLNVEELQGGTFTISNGGVFGSLLSTPIVNPPQSGILGMHRIQDRPVALDGQVVIRPMMYLALTYDHRIVDGRGAVSFLVRLKECLENPVRMLLEI